VKVLLDTNVVLDQLLAREPHAGPAEQVMSLVDAGRLEGLLCATTVTTIHYLASKAVGAAAAADHLRNLLAVFDVARVDRDVLRNALNGRFADFEDAVVYEAALASGAAAIVTRDAKGFAASGVPVFSPVEFLAALRAERQ
jgi:predicted nucleic acid-binding protein